MEIKKCFLKNNDCYKRGRKMIPKGIVVHSTGANNKTLKRYIQPDDGILGVNPNNNDWNHPGISKCVHGFIGVDKNGKVRFYQTLPFDMAPWGCGQGPKGSYNDSYIQFEICEDALNDAKYFNEAFNLAIELCAYLVKQYDIPVKNIVSHHEACLQGYASNHADCDHWLKRFNKSMDWFRNEVKLKITVKPAQSTKPKTFKQYKARVVISTLNIRKGPGTNYKKVEVIKPGTYTIISEHAGTGSKKGWGELKSGKGWISLDFAEKI